MRRRSLVGPLVLILIGALFLINNFRPDLRLFTLFAGEYWPFLIIGFGVLRLIEVLVLAAQSKPLPGGRGGGGGGEIFLVILLCLAGTIFYQVSRHAPSIRIGRRTMEILGESFDYPISQQKAIGEKSRILFDNVRGNVRVSAGDAPEIRIAGRKTIRAYNKSDADKANNQSPLEVIAEGDRVIVRTNQERVSEDRRVTTDLEVTVPRGVSIEGRGRQGDFDIAGIAGGVEIASDNSGVRLNKIGGNVKVDVKRSDIVRAVDVKGMTEVLGRGGDVELENIGGPVSVNGSFGGNLEFKNLAKPLHFQSRNTDFRVEGLPGRISMDLAALTGVNLVGPITLTANSKDIKLDEFTQSLQIELDRGDVELRPHNVPLSKVDVRCRNTGNIDLALPPQAKFELTASTDKGEIRNEYGPPLELETQGRSAKLKGATSVGPAIQLSTARGTVTVRKE
jgi:hypothetical protein